MAHLKIVLNNLLGSFDGPGVARRDVVAATQELLSFVFDDGVSSIFSSEIEFKDGTYKWKTPESHKEFTLILSRFSLAD